MSNQQQQQQRRRKLPPADNTVASKANREIERDLTFELNKYVEAIRISLEKNPSYKWSHLKGLIIPRLYETVQQTIRASVTKSYELGAQYVTDKAGVGASFFLTHADIDSIKELGEEFTNKFFARVQMSLDNTIRREFTKEPADSLLNPNFIVTSVAISAMSKALAEGSRQKAKALIYNSTVNRPVVQAQGEDEFLDEDDPEAIAALFLDPTLEPVEGIALTSAAAIAAAALMQRRWVWVTAGNPCFEYCVPLEGRTWSMFETDIMPKPIVDTHNNCRCRLLLQ